MSLLERYGVLAAGHARAEGVVGGFSAVYSVLSALEEIGRVRRGHFVDGLDGAQFVLAGAVDRLRICREDPGPDDDPAATGAGVYVLAATDPACPWGLALSWPTPGGSGLPRRAAGATVAVVDGRPVIFVDSGGRSLVTFGALSDPRTASRAVRALGAHLGFHSFKGLRVDRVDGGPSVQADQRDALLSAGFRQQPVGLTLDVEL